MAKINTCGQVNIPTVDNTSIECDDMLSSKCVVIKKYCKKVGNLEGETLDDFVGRLCAKLAIMDNKIYLLTKRLGELESSNLVDPVTENSDIKPEQ